MTDHIDPTARADAPDSGRRSHARPIDLGAVTVDLVVVGHNGARWAEEVAAAVAAQTRRPDRIVVVDTGSRDDTGAALADRLPNARVVEVDRRLGFGAAVAAGLAALEPAAAEPRWIWLLHDDCAPAPSALAELLTEALRDPRTGVVGPKLRGWADRRLLEVGVTISRSGRRETGLEPREEDQGQHDDVRRVLVVSSAGMLVRGDVWQRLGGFDPRLPLFRDDVDLGWRANLAGIGVVVAPAAVVRHVEAASSGRRTIDATTPRRHLLDRRSALYVLLANLPARALWLAYPRLIVTTLARSLGFLLGKLPGLALDEAAALTAIGRVDRVWAARRRRRGLREAPDRDVTALLAPRGAQVGRALDSLVGVFSRDQPGADVRARGYRAVESGPTDDSVDDLESDGLAWLRRLLRPGVVLTAVLAVLTAFAARALFGPGRLMGGALLPAPDSAGDLWATYAAAWHDVGLGSTTTAPPYLAGVAAVGSALLGNVSLAVDLLVLASVPLAGITAYVAARRLVTSPWTRVWLAGTYALVPATTGAIAGGRIGTAVASVLLPLLLVALLRVVGDGRAGGSWPSAWAAGLCLAATSAFVPIAYVVVGALLGVVALGVVRSWGVLARLVVVLLVPPLALLPWTGAVIEQPGLLLLEPGLPGPGLSDPQLPPVFVLLQSSGGPGALPWWLGIPLVVGALAALLSRERRSLVLAGWAVAGTGLAFGVAMSLTAVSTPTAQGAVAAWPGFCVAVVSGGLLLATGVGAEGAARRLGRRSFGWRQPTLLLVVLVAALAPLLAAGWWVIRGADDPLVRQDPVVLPAYVAAAGDDPARPRTIVLDRAADGSIRYALVRDTGPRMGDAETGPPFDTFERLDAAVADLVSGRGGDEAEVLEEHAVRYVLVAAPVDEGLVATIDAVPGLRRLSTNDDSALWSLSDTASRLRVEGPTGAVTPLPSGDEGADTALPAGSSGRTVVLAELADPHWYATLDDVRLEPTVVDGWAQGWAVPSAGGQLVIGFDSTERDRWLLAEAIIVALVVLLAVPGARRSESAL